MNCELTLPPLISGAEPPAMPHFRQLTLIGANGAGKTRFMQRLMDLCPDKAYELSALQAFYPEREPSPLVSSIDAQYARALRTSAYLKADAVSEFDKLMFLLFNDECSYLLAHKSRQLFGGAPEQLQPTRLDLLIELWQEIFPENQILRHNGALLFSTASGDDRVSALRLSKGEKAALYYIAATLYAPQDAVIFIDSPSIFLHPALLNTFWNAIERLRPDCRFIYNTYDVGFVATRTEGVCIWVRGFDATSLAWDYQLMAPGHLSDDLTLQLIGARRPVLFIEGDATHSLDAKLYTLVFSDHTVRPLGSCDKVIESTRTFADLNSLHHLDSHGIVDRDRRTPQEVDYLRRKHILVPEVAEVENLFLLEDVVKTMATIRGCNPGKVFGKVKSAVMQLWVQHMDSQALQHVRHRVKRLAECRIDGRFSSIRELERHIADLPRLLNPGAIYGELRADFHRMAKEGDYAGVLRVFNHKPMLAASGVDRLLAYPNIDAYIGGVLATLKAGGKRGRHLADVFLYALRAPQPVKQHL